MDYTTFGPIAQDGTARCHICGGTTTQHQRLELVSGQRIPCPWVDDDNMPDVWASREQYAADVWTNKLTDAQRGTFLDDAFACDRLDILSEFDPRLVGVLVDILSTPVVDRGIGHSLPSVTFTDVPAGVGVTLWDRS